MGKKPGNVGEKRAEAPSQSTGVEANESTDIVGKRLRKRNVELGLLIAEARGDRTITECVSWLGTSRRRFRAIEAGEIGISLAEWEILARRLGLPPQPPHQDDSWQGDPGPIVVRARPGQQVIVDVEPR